MSITEPASASHGAFCISAQCYRSAEDVGIATVVIAPFKLSNVQRKIFSANLMVAAHDTAFQERPEAINGLGMYNAVNILTGAVRDRAMLFELPISGVFVGRNEAHFFRNRFSNEGVYGVGIGAFDDARDQIALALDNANDRSFSTSASANMLPVLFVLVLFLAANVGLVNLNNAHELAELRVSKTSANAMAHIPSGSIRAKSHYAMDLQRRYAFLACQQEINDFEPAFEANVRVLKNRSHKHRKPITASGSAFGALPVKRLVGDGINIFVGAAWASDARRPSARDQVGLASVIGREQFFKLRDRHLVGEFCHRIDSLA